MRPTPFPRELPILGSRQQDLLALEFHQYQFPVRLPQALYCQLHARELQQVGWLSANNGGGNALQEMVREYEYRAPLFVLDGRVIFIYDLDLHVGFSADVLLVMKAETRDGVSAFAVLESG
jgi:hypothetical protein